MNAEYSRTLGEIASSGIEAVGDAVDALIGGSPDEEATSDELAIATSTEKVAEPRHTFITREHKKFIFSAEDDRISTVKDLPWYDPEFAKKVATDRTGQKKITIKESQDGSSLVVKGDCSSAYYVVLMFRGATDYRDRPSSAVTNVAHPCEKGSFTYDHNGIPADTAPGDYFLLIGEEGETGPWIPRSALIPIHIQATTTKETIEI